MEDAALRNAVKMGHFAVTRILLENNASVSNREVQRDSEKSVEMSNLL